MDRVEVINSLLNFESNAYCLHVNIGTFEEVAALYIDIAVRNIIKLKCYIAAIQTGSTSESYQH